MAQVRQTVTNAAENSREAIGSRVPGKPAMPDLPTPPGLRSLQERINKVGAAFKARRGKKMTPFEKMIKLAAETDEKTLQRLGIDKNEFPYEAEFFLGRKIILKDLATFREAEAEATKSGEDVAPVLKQILNAPEDTVDKLKDIEEKARGKKRRGGKLRGRSAKKIKFSFDAEEAANMFDNSGIGVNEQNKAPFALHGKPELWNSQQKDLDNLMKNLGKLTIHEGGITESQKAKLDSQLEAYLEKYRPGVSTEDFYKWWINEDLVGKGALQKFLDL